jgi:hypothetical protein
MAETRHRLVAARRIKARPAKANGANVTSLRQAWVY